MIPCAGVLRHILTVVPPARQPAYHRSDLPAKTVAEIWEAAGPWWTRATIEDGIEALLDQGVIVPEALEKSALVGFRRSRWDPQDTQKRDPLLESLRREALRGESGREQ